MEPNVQASWWPKAILALILAGYATVQAWVFWPALKEDDTAAYLVLAERMAQGGPLAVHDPDPWLYHSHPWVENERGEIVPKYWPGLPALMAVGMWLFGETGAYVVSPVMGGLTLIGAYLLFRLWMSQGASLFAVWALATNAMFLFYATYPLGHISSLCLVTWGMYCLWQWVRSLQAGWGIGAGLALGASVLVRATDLLFAPVLAVALIAALWRMRKERRFRAAAVVGLLGGYAVFPLVLAWYNYAIFGSPFTTGYALSEEQGAFGLEYLRNNLGYLFRGLQNDCLSVYFPLGLIGLWVARPWSERFMRVLWFLPTFLLYSAYYWLEPRHGWADTRFLMECFPLLIGSSFVLLDQFAVTERKRWLLMAAVCAVVFLWRWPVVGMRAGIEMDVALQQQKLAADQAAGHLREGTVIFASPPAAYHISRGKHFRMYDLSVFDRGYWRGISRPHRGEPRRQPSRTERLEAFAEQHQETLVEDQQALVRSFLVQGRSVAYIVPKDSLDRIQRALGDQFAWQTLSEWEAVGRVDYTRRGADWVTTNPGRRAWELCEVRLAGEK